MFIEKYNIWHLSNFVKIKLGNFNILKRILHLKCLKIIETI